MSKSTINVILDLLADKLQPREKKWFCNQVAEIGVDTFESYMTGGAPNIEVEICAKLLGRVTNSEGADALFPLVDTFIKEEYEGFLDAHLRFAKEDIVQMDAKSVYNRLKCLVPTQLSEAVSKNAATFLNRLGAKYTTLDSYEFMLKWFFNIVQDYRGSPDYFNIIGLGDFEEFQQRMFEMERANLDMFQKAKQIRDRSPMRMKNH